MDKKFIYFSIYIFLNDYNKESIKFNIDLDSITSITLGKNNIDNNFLFKKKEQTLYFYLKYPPKIWYKNNKNDIKISKENNYNNNKNEESKEILNKKIENGKIIKIFNTNEDEDFEIINNKIEVNEDKKENKNFFEMNSSDEDNKNIIKNNKIN